VASLVLQAASARARIVALCAACNNQRQRIGWGERVPLKQDAELSFNRARYFVCDLPHGDEGYLLLWSRAIESHPVAYVS